MDKTLPVTPAQVLEISTLRLRLKTMAMVALARLFGFWRHPVEDAATALEEMSLRDIYYWVYKSKYPVTLLEKSMATQDTFNRDASVVQLPQGFSKAASVTIGAGGDLLRCQGLEHAKDRLYENIADILFDQDIAYANLESPITGQTLVDEVLSDVAPPTECCSRRQFDILKGHRGKNFHVLNTCNNHIFDMGVEGLQTTRQVLAENNILEVGTNGQPEEYSKAKILTKNTIKIGFASATFGLNGRQLPKQEAYRINVSRLLSKFADPELQLLQKQIDHCKQAHCDFIIASIHWGYEFEFFPRQRQIDAARALVEYGADAILCHHPHVMQPVEYYRTKRDPNRVAVIAYSLGSITWGFTAPHIVLSAIANLNLAKGVLQGSERTYIENARVTPVFRSVFTEDGKIISRIEKLADCLNRKNNVHSSAYINRIKNYADLVLGTV